MTAQEPLLELRGVMARLRAECPWKREQTHRSLLRYLLEEAYETVEAVESGDPEPDPDHLREELGDLLLQDYFHAAVAADGDVVISRQAFPVAVENFDLGSMGILFLMFTLH